MSAGTFSDIAVNNFSLFLSFTLRKVLRVNWAPERGRFA